MSPRIRKLLLLPALGVASVTLTASVSEAAPADDGFRTKTVDCLFEDAVGGVEIDATIHRDASLPEGQTGELVMRVFGGSGALATERRAPITRTDYYYLWSASEASLVLRSAASFGTEFGGSVGEASMFRLAGDELTFSFGDRVHFGSQCTVNDG